MTREQYEVLALKAVKKAAGSVDHTNLVWFGNELHVHVFYCPNVPRCETELLKIPDSEFGLSLFGYTSDNTPHNIWCDSKRNRDMIGQEQQEIPTNDWSVLESIPEPPVSPWNAVSNGTSIVSGPANIPARPRRRNRRSTESLSAQIPPTPEQMEIARQRLQQINETQGRVSRQELGTAPEPEF